MDKKEKGKKRSWGLYVLAFCVPVIGLLVHMLIGKCYPFGDNSILLGDAKDQYLSFFKELYDRLKNGQSLLFSWNGGMGYDFYCNMMYYLMSPFMLNRGGSSVVVYSQLIQYVRVRTSRTNGSEICL